MLGPKIDARLNTLERKLADLTHRLERLESAPQDAPLLEVPVVTLPVDVPKRRGRPPKAKNG